MAKRIQVIDREEFSSFMQNHGTFIGGGQTGGSVVQYTPQSVASAAGQDEVNAANAAEQLAQTSITDALQSVNQNYNQSVATLNPYSEEGVQAEDQMNQLMGLSPYNPGVAPLAPTAPNLQADEADISQAQVQQYVNENITPIGTDQTGGFGLYTGVENPGQNANNTGAYSNVSEINKGTAGPGLYGTANVIENNLGINGSPGNEGYQTNNPVSALLAQPTYQMQQQLYPTLQQGYNQDLNSYDQNLAWYNQYQAQGPMNANQIQTQVENQPGFQAQLGQGIQAINQDAAAKGYLGSGGMLQALNSLGSQQLSQYYGNELSRLSGLVNTGASAASQQATEANQNGQTIASLYNSLGTTQADAALSAGSAEAQAEILGGQQYMTVGQQQSSGAAGLGSLLSGASSLLGSKSAGTGLIGAIASI